MGGGSTTYRRSVRGIAGCACAAVRTASGNGEKIEMAWYERTLDTMAMISTKQKAICSRFGAAFEPPFAGSRLGIALQTLQLAPLHGLRHPPEKGTCGWYIWAGELSDSADFFQPLCVEHLTDR